MCIERLQSAFVKSALPSVQIAFPSAQLSVCPALLVSASLPLVFVPPATTPTRCPPRRVVCPGPKVANVVLPIISNCENSSVRVERVLENRKRR